MTTQTVTTPEADDRLRMIANYLVDHNRHAANAKTLMDEALLSPAARAELESDAQAEAEQDGEDYTPDHVTPAQYQAAAAIQAQLALAAATAAAALATVISTR